MSGSSDRNLLFGILALQMDFITREQLVAGMQAWALQKELILAEHLVMAGALKPSNRQLLEPLVEAHIGQHGDDPHQSLASISSVEGLRNELAQLKDQELDVSLAQIPKGRRAPSGTDPYATVSVGETSSHGMRFRILRPHAEGGLGRVSVALDGELGREVALKEIKPERADDPDSRGRFTREAEITGGLEHPGIVPVYGLGAYPDGRPFYAMRFIRGKSLKEAIEKFHSPFTTTGVNHFHDKAKKPSATEQNLELRKLLQRLIDVCEAMNYAHSRGVLHRDLKPGNIMLGKYGETLVVDWGLAKPLGKSPPPNPEQKPADTTVDLSSLPEAALNPSSSGGSEPTILGSALGTPAYMSPEQAQGRLDLLGPASDVFSLGAILYQILTGQPPYVAATKDELLRKAANADYLIPRSVHRGLPLALEAICLKALAPLSVDRYLTCQELARDIERFLADEPVMARRESMAQRFSRLTRRYRTWVQAASTALVLVSASSVIALFVVNHFRSKANATAQRNATLVAEMKEKNREIQLSLATNYFDHGCAEYLHGRPGNAAAELREALHATPADHPSRDAIQEILIDRVMLGGKLQLPPIRHPGVHRIAFSPDGTKLATDGFDNTVRIWSVATGQRVGAPLVHDSLIHHHVFSSDGTKLATACSESVRIWNVATGQSVGEPLRHDKSVTALEFSPDGTKLATASMDKTARVWSLVLGTNIEEPLQHDNSVYDLDFSPDGTKLATASRDSVCIWNVATCKRVGEPLRHDDYEERDWINFVSFSPDGTRLATKSGKGKAWVWNVNADLPSGEPLRDDDVIRHLAFSPDGTRIATGSEDATCQIWDAASAQKMGKSIWHGATVSFVAFSPDGTKLVTAGGEMLWIWDTITHSQIGGPLGFDSRIADVVFSPDSTGLATASDDGVVRICNLVMSPFAGEWLRHDEYVQKFTFSPDGARLATASGLTSRIWNLVTGQPVGKPLQHDDVVSCVVFSADGTKLVTTNGDTVRICSATTGVPIGKPFQHEGGVMHVAFSPDGAKLATTSFDGTTQVWDTATSQPSGERQRFESGYTDFGGLPLANFFFSSDWTRVATASDDGTAQVWNVLTGQQVGEPLLHAGKGVQVVFSSDATRIVTLFNNTAQVWNSTTGKPTGKPLQHNGVVNRAALNADGTNLAVAFDKTCQIWNVDSGRPIGAPLRSGSDFLSLEFSPDGTKLATACMDYTVRIWQVATGQTVGEPLSYGGDRASFSPDGKALATAGREAAIGMWVVPSVPRLKASELELWLTAMTGQRLEESGDLVYLKPDELPVASKELEEIQNWQDFLAENRNRSWRQRRIDVLDSTIKQHWFAAAFQLRWALKKEPGNEELKKRLAVAEQKLKEEQEAAKKASPQVEPPKGTSSHERAAFQPMRSE